MWLDSSYVVKILGLRNYINKFVTNMTTFRVTAKTTNKQMVEVKANLITEYQV